MNLIAAADRNWGIGKDGELLKRISRDMKFFSSKTTGQVIVMGRKTLESFPGGKPLPNRINIVMTGNPAYDGRGAVVVHDLMELKTALAACEDKEISVSGGGGIYKLLLPYCDTAYITRIDEEYPADTWMPNLDEAANWKITEAGEPLEEKGTSFRFLTYKNDRPEAL